MNLLVVTATRGDCPHLGETVRSVANQRGDVRHLIVCPAGTRAKVAAMFPGVEVISESGAGLYAALNSARDKAGSADWVTWINDDDLLDESGLEAACELLARSPNVGLVYGRVDLIHGAGRRLGEIPVARRPVDLGALLGAGIMPLAQPGTLIRRSLLDELGWFDPTYRLAGDLDLFVRALKRGAVAAYVDARVACFRLHAGQLSKDETRAQAEHARAVAALEVSAAGNQAALRRFRWDNRWVYVRRLLRHGPRRMVSLYRHA